MTNLRAWTACAIDEGKVQCEGVGSVMPGEAFFISANGYIFDVVVVNIRTPGPLWTAIDRKQYEERYCVQS